jgi:DNA-directed RNA polymerase specialized sigma24 family protein
MSILSLEPLAAKSQLDHALAGNAQALKRLVAELTPLIRRRVVFALYGQRGRALNRALAQESEDLSQEVLVELFQRGGALASWDPSRGRSLGGFVRLIADRTVASILRSGRRTPWRDLPVDPHDLCELRSAPASQDERAISRDLFARVRQSLTHELTPLGLRVFEVLFVEDADVATAAELLAMRPQSVYAWRNRLVGVLKRVAVELEQERRRPACQTAC